MGKLVFSLPLCDEVRSHGGGIEHQLSVRVDKLTLPFPVSVVSYYVGNVSRRRQNRLQHALNANIGVRGMICCLIVLVACRHVIIIYYV